MLGNDESYVKEREEFEVPYIRVSLKAGLPEKWEGKTEADRKSFELPYKAIEYLWKEDIDFHVAAMADPNITSKKEIESIYRKVSEVPKILAENIEWEIVDLYPNIERQLKDNRHYTNHDYFSRKSQRT